MGRIGQIAWNKGTKGLIKPNKGSFKKGEHRSIATEFKKGSMVRWKGLLAGYVSKHMWISRKRGKPTVCEHCYRTNLKGRQIHWANIDHKYSRKLKDYLRLCAKCHGEFDKLKGLRKHKNDK